jgi:hypothetical protein
MYTEIIPYANIIVGILLFIVGFIFHWIFQLISTLNWNLATKIGVQEKGMLPEYKVYEHAIATTDSMLGWIYGIAAVGLILNTSWAYKLAWIPAVILVYHGLSCWFWMGNQNKTGHQLTTNTFRFLWFLLNFGTGVLCIIIIW